MTLQVALRPTNEQVSRRRFERHTLNLSVTVSSPMVGNFPAIVLNISAGGLLLQLDAETLLVGDHVSISLPDKDTKAKVVWRNGPFYGCEFRQEASTASLSATRLQAAPEVSWGGSRERETSSYSYVKERRNVAQKSDFLLPFLIVAGTIGMAATAIGNLIGR